MPLKCKIVADDYGMSNEINEAIIDLVKKKVVKKVSVIAVESLPYSSKDFGENIEIGLHINLLSKEIIKTGSNKKKINLLKFLYLLLIKKLESKQIINNIDKQFKILEQKGFRISYLDTHQHVHIIPPILKLIIMYAKTKKINSIRCITMEKRFLSFYLNSLIRFGFLKQLPKIMFLYLMGILMKKILDKSGINYCKNLILMPLAKDGNYAELLKRFLCRFENEEAEIITHPGLKTRSSHFDDYNERYIEYYSMLDIIS